MYLLVALTKIEIGVMGNTASDEQKATSLLPISDISISNIFEKITPYDKNFLKYVLNQFLNYEQIKAIEIVVRDKGKKQFLYEVKFIENKKIPNRVCRRMSTPRLQNEITKKRSLPHLRC